MYVELSLFLSCLSLCFDTFIFDSLFCISSATAASDNVSDDDEATLAAAFAISADQVAKVHLGRVRTMAAFFGKQIIVHINVLPLVVAMVAEPDANVGVLMALEQDFVKALAALRTSVEQLDKI
jgi:hypothetical protein